MSEDGKVSWTQYVENEYRGRTKDKTYRTQMQIARETDAEQRMLDILFDDTHNAMREATENPGDHYKYRTLVRTMFAHIEGELSLMKQSIIRWYRLQAISLSKTQLRQLTDEEIILGDGVGIVVKPIRLSLEDSLQLTFKMMGLTPGRSPIKLDTASAGWQSFCKAIRIRNNLMHPKSEANLQLTEDDYVLVMLGWQWYTIAATEVHAVTSPDVFQNETE